MSYAFVSGSLQYIGGSAPVSIAPCTLFAMSFPADNTTGSAIVSLGNAVNAGGDYFFTALNGDVAGDPGRVGVVSAAPAVGVSASAASYNVSAWNSLVGVFQSTSSRAVALNGTTAAVNTTSVTPTNINVVGIGAINRTAPASYASANIAECAIWDVALSAGEINSLTKGFKPSRIRPQSLVFYAPLLRELRDWRAGRALTNNNGATVTNHPRVY
jgi:hypothetical protein